MSVQVTFAQGRGSDGSLCLWASTKCFSLKDRVATIAKGEITVAKNSRESSQSSLGSQR